MQPNESQQTEDLKEQLKKKVDKHGKQYFEQIQQACDKVLECKVALHQNKDKIEEKHDQLQTKIGICESGISTMQQEMGRIQTFVA